MSAKVSGHLSRSLVRKKYRRRRNWTDDEKRTICAQTRVRGVSVSKVARRYDVNANQVFNWLKDPRFADAEPAEAEPSFLSVEISDAPEIVFADDNIEPGTLEIDLACGHRLRITGSYDVDALVRLIHGLSA